MRHPDLRYLLPAAAIILSSCASTEAMPTSTSPFLPPPTAQADGMGGVIWRFSGLIGPNEKATLVCSGSSASGARSFNGCFIEGTPSTKIDREGLCDQSDAGLIGQGTVFLDQKAPPGGVKLFLTEFNLKPALDPYLQCHTTQANQNPKDDFLDKQL